MVWIYVNMVENRAKPTQTSFEWSSKSVCAEKRNDTYTLTCTCPDMDHPNILHFNETDTNTHTYAGKGTHIHTHVRWHIYTNGLRIHSNIKKRIYTTFHIHLHLHIHRTEYATYFICTCGRSITKILELNEFAKKNAKQLVLRIHTKLHIEQDNTFCTFIVFNHLWIVKKWIYFFKVLLLFITIAGLSVFNLCQSKFFQIHK